MNVISSFPKRLAEAMNGMGVTALATKLGVSKQSVSAWLNGTRKPKKLTLTAMAQILSVHPEWLMGYDVNKMGYDVNKNVAAERYDGKTLEFINLFSQLTTEQQFLIIFQIKGILANQDQPKKTYAIKKAARHGNFEKKTITDTELDEIKCLHDVNDLK